MRTPARGTVDRVALRKAYEKQTGIPLPDSSLASILLQLRRNPGKKWTKQVRHDYELIERLSMQHRAGVQYVDRYAVRRRYQEITGLHISPGVLNYILARISARKRGEDSPSTNPRKHDRALLTQLIDEHRKGPTRVIDRATVIAAYELQTGRALSPYMLDLIIREIRSRKGHSS